jgi:hypothetical protein
MLLICLYIGKYEKLFLIAIDEDESFLIEHRVIIFKTFHKFAIGQIVNVKMKESGKSTKCYNLILNIVDGRQFWIFYSGIKEKTLKKQFMIRRFLEEYFENKIPKS